MFLYVIIVLLFFIDISFFILVEKPFIYSLLSAYLVLLLKKPGRIMIIFTLSLLALESHLYTGHADLQLIYGIPITLMGIVVHQIMQLHIIPGTILLIASILAHTTLMTLYIPEFSLNNTYTFFIINANMIIQLLFFGIFRLQGKQGNRL